MDREWKPLTGETQHLLDTTADHDDRIKRLEKKVKELETIITTMNTEWKLKPELAARDMIKKRYLSESPEKRSRSPDDDYYSRNARWAA